MEIIIIIIRNIFICLVSSIPGLLLTQYLEKKGFVRKESKVEFFFWVLFFAILTSILGPKTHWLILLISTLLITTLGFNRFELWYSMQKGRKWWINKKNED